MNITTQICKEREALMLEDIKKIRKTDISKVELPRTKNDKSAKIKGHSMSV